MSHISTVSIEIDDLQSLADAARELGLELRRDQKTFRTFAGTTSKCFAAIVLPGPRDAYEIGVVKANGKYRLQHDDFAGGEGMVAQAGTNCSKLLVEYARAKTKRIARAKGWSYREERQQDGGVRCYVSPPGSWSQQSQQSTGKRW